MSPPTNTFDDTHTLVCLGLPIWGVSAHVSPDVLYLLRKKCYLYVYVTNVAT